MDEKPDEVSAVSNLGEQSIHITPPPEAPDNDIAWDSELEQRTVEIGREALAYKLMHSNAATLEWKKWKRVTKLYNWFSPIPATLGIIYALMYPDDHWLIPVIGAVLSFLVAVLGRDIQKSNYKDNSKNYKLASSRFLGLESNVRRIVKLKRHQRPVAGTYMKWLSDSMDDVLSGAPFVEPKIAKQYIRHTKDPLVMDHDFRININRSQASRPSTDAKALHALHHANQRFEINSPDRQPVTSHSLGHQLSRSSPPPPYQPEIQPLKEKDYDNTKNKVYVPYAEANKFDDAKMKYEMQRFMGQ